MAMPHLPWFIRWRLIKHKRRSLEAHLFTIGALNAWSKVKEENEAMGIWRK